jgi:2-oxoglutarate ferredoxin oxidoreductase subunit beta
VNSPKNVISAGRVVRQAFEAQVKEGGFGFVEVLSACPTNWGMGALEANERIGDEMIPYFPLGIFKEAGRRQGDASAQG